MSNPGPPPGLWCPFATHKPISEAWTQPAITVRAAIVHSAGGHGELTGWWNSDASHGLESTVFICDDQTGHGFTDGEIVQYLGVGIRADANGDANSFATSIETASSISAGERWTPAQAEALTRFLDWHATATGTPRRLMATPTDAGIAWHVQFGAPGPWTKVRGKVCPGPARVSQLVDEIIPAVAAMAAPTTDPEDLTVADITDITQRLDALAATQAEQGKKLDKLYQDYAVSREPDKAKPGDNGSKRWQLGRMFLWLRDNQKGA